MKDVASLFDPSLPIEEPPKSWTTSEIATGLNELFPPQSHALIFEVPDGTGSNKRRTADALVMSLWPSRGLDLFGLEIKSSRSDWAKELKEPSKAESLAKYCDFWFLVVGNKDIVGPGELPSNWGLIAPKGGKLKIAKEAVRLADPKPIGRKFLAAIFRRATERIVAEDPIKLARDEGYKAGFEAGKLSEKDCRGYEVKRLESSVEMLRKSIEDFEQTSGIRLDHWSGGRIGEAVKVVMNGGFDHAKRKMDRIEEEAKTILAIVDRFRDAEGGGE